MHGENEKEQNKLNKTSGLGQETARATTSLPKAN